MSLAAIRLPDELSRQVRFFAISVAAWGAVATLFLLQRLSATVLRGGTLVWDRVAIGLIVTWGTWALLTPLILAIVRRLPLPSERRSAMLLHAPIGVGIGLLHSLLVAAIMPLLLWRPSFLPMRLMFAGRLASTVAWETLIYFMVVAALYAWIYSTQATGQRALPDSLVIPQRDGLLRVPIASIDWLKSEDNYVRIHAGGRSYLMRATLSSLEQKLAPGDFVRIHRSAVVAFSRISKVRKLAADRYAVVLSNGVELRVSRAYQKRVLDSMRSLLAPE